MIIITILLGIMALMGAYAAGITQSWLGTAATSAIVLLMAVAAIPGAWWLFDDAVGYACTMALWVASTAFYHRLLCAPLPMRTDRRRQTPTIELKRRHVIGWSFGRYQVGVAVGVSA